MIAGMENASNRFYLAATQIGNHAFIEFTGLMNEYIKICAQTMKGGQDFTAANTHVGGSLKIEPYNIAYLLEKLDCIYGPSIAAAVREKFGIDAT